MNRQDVLSNFKKVDKKKTPKHLTMMVIPHCQGGPVKNYRIPMWLIKAVALISISCVLVVGYFVTGYFYLNYVRAENLKLKEVNVAQSQEINELKGLAGHMKTKLEALVKLDQEVREKVGLSKPSQEEKTVRELDSSRSQENIAEVVNTDIAASEVDISSVQRMDERYELMTMGLGLTNTTTLEDKEMISTQAEEMPSITASIGGGLDSEGYQDITLSQEQILQLPILDEDINTLDELKDQLTKMDLLMTEQTESINQLNTDVDKRLAYLNALPDSWPIYGRITSSFGWRRNPYRRNSREFHDGIDIASSYGSPIKAAGAGVVTFAGWKSSWGRLVIISHGYGYVSQYAHNSSLLVKPGDKVKKGQIIARLGSTGRSTGPHVHFGVAQNGKWINPRNVLK